MFRVVNTRIDQSDFVWKLKMNLLQFKPTKQLFVKKVDRLIFSHSVKQSTVQDNQGGERQKKQNG